MIEQTQILEDLIAATSGEEEKWFATAKSIGMLPLALELAHKSPCDPRTLNRAARDYIDKEPKFALGVAIASLHWLAEGWGYEITGIDVLTAYDHAIKAAEKIGVEKEVHRDIREIVENDKSAGTFVKNVLKRYLDPDSNFSRK